jgi:hypothetical protein
MGKCYYFPTSFLLGIYSTKDAAIHHKEGFFFFFFFYLKDIYTSIMDLGLDMYLQLRVRFWWNLMVSTLSENQFHFPFSLSSLCIRNWGITVLSITISWKKGFKIERPSVSLEGQARKLRYTLAMFLIKNKHGKVF